MSPCCASAYHPPAWPRVDTGESASRRIVNPPHLGHLLIAQDALEAAELDLVKFVPAAVPPHKDTGNLAPAPDRLAMLRRAVRGQRRFVVDDLELRRGGPSFTIDTVAALRRAIPGPTSISSSAATVCPSCRVGGRPTALVRALAGSSSWSGLGEPATPPNGANCPGRFGAGSRYRWVTGHACSLASRDIRARVAAALSIHYLVPGAGAPLY